MYDQHQFTWQPYLIFIKRRHMTTKKLPEKLQLWVDVRKKHHLSHMQIQMARELGLNPKKFGRLDNHQQETWKEPLPKYIETLYYKQISKVPPAEVKSIENLYKAQQQKKQDKKQAKLLTVTTEPSSPQNS